MFEIGMNMYQGIAPGSRCAPEIQGLPCFRGAEISAHGNIPGLLWEGGCWFSEACKCGVAFPFKGACCFCKIHAYTWELRKLCLKCYCVIISCFGRLWHFSLDVPVLVQNSPVEEGKIPGPSFGLLGIVCILDPTLGTVPGWETCTASAAVLRLNNISIKQG